MKKYQALIRKFTDAEVYEQDEPGDARFNWLIKDDEFPGIKSGRVRLIGPIHKTPATHIEWDQAYFILSGRAIIHLAGQSMSISEPAVVLIPRGTHHSVEVGANEEIEYLFVNQYLLE